MKKTEILEKIDKIVAEIEKQITIQPKIAMILGSGLGELSELLSNPVMIPIYFESLIDICF